MAIYIVTTQTFQRRNTNRFLRFQNNIKCYLLSFTGGILYTAHGTQITLSPSLSFIFIFFLILGQVRLSYGQACPAGLGKRFSQGPAWLEPLAGVELEKKEKYKKLGGYWAPRVNHGIVLLYFYYLFFSNYTTEQRLIACQF